MAPEGENPAGEDVFETGEFEEANGGKGFGGGADAGVGLTEKAIAEVLCEMCEKRL